MTSWLVYTISHSIHFYSHVSPLNILNTNLGPIKLRFQMVKKHQLVGEPTSHNAKERRLGRHRCRDAQWRGGHRQVPM